MLLRAPIRDLLLNAAFWSLPSDFMPAPRLQATAVASRASGTLSVTAGSTAGDAAVTTAASGAAAGAATVTSTIGRCTLLTSS